MTETFPADEDALVERAVARMKEGKLVSPRVGIHPAYQATAVPKPSVAEHGQFFKRAINAAYLAHFRGERVSYEAITAIDGGLADPTLYELMESPLFRQACESRGIPHENTDFLNEEQVAALAILADHSVRRPERAKLKAAGVSWEKFQGWLHNPIFRREYRAMQNRVLELATERGDTVLAQLIDDGNMRAIEYANAMTGRYDPASREAVNTMSILQMVMSLVQKHVTDEVTLLKLSQDMERLATQGGLPQLEIMDAEVVEPPSE